MTGGSFLIHGVAQGIDPSEVAVENAIVRNLTTVLAGAPSTTLFSYIEGASFPATACPAPIDSAAFANNTPTLDIERQCRSWSARKEAD